VHLPIIELAGTRHQLLVLDKHICSLQHVQSVVNAPLYIFLLLFLTHEPRGQPGPLLGREVVLAATVAVVFSVYLVKFICFAHFLDKHASDFFVTRCFPLLHQPLHIA